MKRFLLLCFIFFCLINSSHSQISIAYPVASQSITRNLDSTLLTVQVAFAAACNATTVTLKLPMGVEYIPGSALKIAGSAGISIAESNISNKRKPVFALNGIVAAGDISFQVKRKAGCGSGANGKDSVLVNGSCGSVTEDAANVNSYNLFSPALNISAPAAISNTYLNNVYSRSGAITNGGNGCIDTLRFYIVNPGAGIQLINNEIIVNGISIVNYRAAGDTLFFKIYGPSFFGGSNLLCNGQSVIFTENIRVKQCNPPNTIYNAGWGNIAGICQSATTYSNTTTANGNAKPVATVTELQGLSYCRDGIYTIKYKNNGTGGKAGAMYNVIAYMGHNYSYAYTFMPRLDPKVDIKNLSVNGIPVTAAIIASPFGVAEQVYRLDFAQLLSDPDGAALGLDDLDGDGQFDDLAPGKSVLLRFEEEWNCDNLCPVASYDFSQKSALGYSSMCGGTATTPNLILSEPYDINLIESMSIIAPDQAQSGLPFTTQVCMNGEWLPPSYRPTDSLYLDITLPAGFSLAGTGNIMIDGLLIPSSQYSFVGNKLSIFKKGCAKVICFSYDLVYTCGATGAVTINYALRYVGDNSCNCQERIACIDKGMNVKCAVSCATGIVNYQPVVKRVSMGFTDHTLSTRVSPVSVTGIALKTALPKDTVVMSIAAKQTGNYNNLRYYYQLKKASGEDVLNFISGTFYHMSSATGVVTTCAVAAPVMSSTASRTKFTFNLTACLPGSSIANNDSVWIDMKYEVTKADNGYLYGNKLTVVPNTLSYFYNEDASANKIYCDSWTTDFLVCGVWIEEAYYESFDVEGCGQMYLTGEIKPYYEDPVDLFPNEYRPVAEVDSIVVILPAGYVYDASGASSMDASFWADATTIGYHPIVAVTPVINGNRITIKNPKNGTWYLSDYSQTNNYDHNRYHIPVKATCATGIGEVMGGSEFYVNNYFYADKVGEAYQRSYPTDATTPLNLNAINKPTITLQNITGPVAGVSEQHYWDVQINNPGIQTAPSLWMALEKGTSGITIDSVVYKPSNIVATGLAYAAVNKWYKISSAGLAGGGSEQVRIYFRYSKCTSDSIRMLAGWNCTGYPTDPLAYSCQSLSQWLTVNPLPGQVQIAISKQPALPSASMCTTDTVSVIVNSAQAGDINNPVLKIIPPIGLVISNPVRVEYPLGSGAWQDITASLVSGEYFLNLESHTGIGINGLKGTIKKPLAADRQVKVDVLYQTTCGFTSGTKLNFVIQGLMSCGAPAIGNNDQVRSNPIQITGANGTGGAATDISISNATIQCGTATTLNVTITPLISPTTNTDTVNIILPPGISYVGGSFAGCVACALSSEAGAGGSSIMKLKLPQGIATSTAISFTIDVEAAADAECGQYLLDVQTVRSGSLLSCGAFVCSAPTPNVLSAASGTITVKKASLQVLEFKLLGAGPFFPGNTYNSNVKVQNFGSINATAGYIVEYFCVGDANPFASRLLPAMNINQVVNITSNITIPASCPGALALMAKIRKITSLPSVVTQCLCDESFALNAIVLPVKLISFKAKAAGSSNIISWKTANEIAGSVHELQRSTDAVHFKKITELTVNNVQQEGYIFTDDTPGAQDEKVFYRMQLLAKNGSILQSEIATVTRNEIDQPMTVSPNPANTYFTAEFYAAESEQAKVMIIDMGNKKIKEWDNKLLKGMNSLTFNDLGSIASGVYIVKIVGNGTQVAHKLVIVK